MNKLKDSKKKISKRKKRKLFIFLGCQPKKVVRASVPQKSITSKKLRRLLPGLSVSPHAHVKSTLHSLTGSARKSIQHETLVERKILEINRVALPRETCYATKGKHNVKHITYHHNHSQCLNNSQAPAIITEAAHSGKQYQTSQQ